MRTGRPHGAERFLTPFKDATLLRRTEGRPHPPGPLTLAAVAVAALVAAPVLSVCTAVFVGGTAGTWNHLGSTVLPEYVANTAWLCAGVGVGTAIVGVSTAWLVSVHEFPGRRVFEWALALPLAVPGYVMAYAYTDLLQFSGPVQTALRTAFRLEPGSYWFPDVRTVGGAVTMFVFVLYPYVYLLARTAFLERASGMIEVGRSLGLGPWQSFFRVSLPLARPAIAAGLALALMETLADYGTVAYFGVHTFTTGIYRAWFSLGDRVASAQLATALLAFVVLLLVLERASRGRARFDDATGRSAPRAGQRLAGAKAVAAVVACVVPLAVGFALPAGVLLEMALTEGDAQFGSRFLRLARNSFTLAAVTAAVAVVLALLLAYAARRSRSAVPRAANRLVLLGYATPGSVIAVGVLIPVSRIDHWLASALESSLGLSVGLLLTGGIAALVYAYLARFLSVALQVVDSSLARITPAMDDAARSLGCGEGETLRRVHVPLLRGGVLTAALLVFVDVMKELPATLVMRPFGFDTLATQAYQLASDERLAEASTSALAIVAVGVLPLVAISREIAERRQRS
jgi:iron(III) transport system permease protein